MNVLIYSTGVIPYNGVGLPNAVIARANALVSEHNVTILEGTSNAQLDYNREKLYEHKLSSEVEVLNLYNSKSSSFIFDYSKYLWIEQKEIVNGATISRGYKNGRYCYCMYKIGYNTILDEIDAYGERCRRLFVVEKNHINRIEYYNREQKLRNRIELSRNKEISIFYSPSNSKVSSIIVSNGKETKTFHSLIDYMGDELKKIVEEHKIDVIISEYAFQMDLLETLSIPVIYQWHSTHFLPPYSKPLNIKPEQKKFFDSINKIDHLVVLTEEQNSDIINDFGISKDKVSTIGNLVDESFVKKPIPRDNKLCVFLGRYDNLSKKIFDSIDAFTYVKVPDAKFELFGRGPDEKNIKEYCKNYDNIKVNGFADASVVYSEALISLYTSAYEGQCISLMESMKLGCIPISFDFKYGPNDLIIDGYNGFIIKNRDVKEMASKIELLMNDSKLQEEMSNNCIDSMKNISKDEVLDKWNRVFDKVILNKR